MPNLSGSILVKDVPVPRPGKGFALVKTAFSLVSAGTERTTSEFAEKNLAAKAIARPDLVKQVAWSPMESLVAAFMRLPLGHFGYNMGALRLNQRVFAPHELLAAAEKESRVPDILPN